MFLSFFTFFILRLIFITDKTIFPYMNIKTWIKNILVYKLTQLWQEMTSLEIDIFVLHSEEFILSLTLHIIVL